MNLEKERLGLEGRISDLVSNHLTALFELWEQTGFTREDRDERMTVVERQVDQTLTEMIDEEKKNFDELLKKIQKREREHIALSKELGITVNEESRADKLSTLTILQLDKVLREEVLSLKALKEERMKEVLELKMLDEEICAKLKVEPIYVPSKAVPTDEQMETLKKHIKDMKALKSQRFAQFSEMKCEILNLYEKMDSEPKTSFERLVICEDDEAFILSSSNLESVEKMLYDLQNQLEANIKYADQIRERISVLFEKLDLPGKDSFLAAHRGFSKMVIEELELKKKELDELKSQHLEEFIEKVRKELKSWWDLCYYGAGQREQFEPYHSTDYSEELLEKHEFELDRIKSHYNHNSSLFAMVNECQELWAKRLELERGSRDPSRLGNYKVLAQEEKDRKRVTTRLPKIEEKLFLAIEKYEFDHGNAFLVGGVPFKDYWKGQVEKHEDELQAEKQQKNTLKKQMNYHETVYGSVPASANKTAVRPSNKRTREDQTPNGNAKQPKMERSATVSALSSARSATLQRTHTHSSLSAARSMANLHKSRYAISTKNKLAPRQVLKDHRNEETFIAAGSGNMLRSTNLDSVDSNSWQAGVHAEAISSTFMRSEPEAHKASLRGVYGTPSKPQTKTSTPMTAPANSKGPFTFRTPSSRALTPVNRNKNLTLRSGKKLPFLI